MLTDAQPIDTLLDDLERLEKSATPGTYSVRLNPYTNKQTAYLCVGELDHEHYQRPADAEYAAALHNAAHRLFAIARAAQKFLREAPLEGDYALLLLALKAQALTEEQQGWVQSYSTARHRLCAALEGE